MGVAELDAVEVLGVIGHVEADLGLLRESVEPDSKFVLVPVPGSVVLWALHKLL